MQIVAALASRRPRRRLPRRPRYAADAVALARGQRPETWDLAVALAEPAPAQTPAATAANLGFVVAHMAARSSRGRERRPVGVCERLRRERAWQLEWLTERLRLEG